MSVADRSPGFGVSPKGPGFGVSPKGKTMFASPYLRRATTSVLVAVGLTSGAILLLGDRFDAAPGYALTQPVRIDAHIAACVAEESMRLIDSGRERCQPGELALESERVHS